MGPAWQKPTKFWIFGFSDFWEFSQPCVGAWSEHQLLSSDDGRPKPGLPGDGEGRMWERQPQGPASLTFWSGNGVFCVYVLLKCIFVYISIV